MFKPTNFRLKNTIFWPGIGPANEIAAENILKIVDEGEDYLFVHASGSAVKVPKAQVTAYGVFDADDVPNLPTEGAYKDGNNADTDTDDKNTPTRTGGNSTPLPTEPMQPEPVKQAGDDTPSAGIDPVDADTDADNDDEFQSSGNDTQGDAATDSDDAIAPPSTLEDAPVEAQPEQDDTDSATDDASAPVDAIDSGSAGDTVRDTDPESPDAPVYSDPDTDASFNTPSTSFDDDDMESDDAGSDVSETPSFTLGKKTKKKNKK